MIDTNEEQQELTETAKPDEGSESLEQAKGQAYKEMILSFEYDVKNTEEEQAFRAFQKKYVYKGNIIKTVLFGIVSVLFMISFIRYPDEYLYPVLTFISLAFIFITWFNTVKIRKSLLEALKVLENDRYIFTLFDDRFSIETILDESEFDEDEEIPVIKPRIVIFKETEINVIEKSDMFVLILKKDTIYVLPKRCFDEKYQGELRKAFKTAIGESYEQWQ
ncbi:MAG: YcxB family protein [Ruminococcus sp.]|nr:YcxB family protein [Ruminococcus sp.]MBR1750061.1 YcxB family protein [Ruminococcus sp.]